MRNWGLAVVVSVLAAALLAVPAAAQPTDFYGEVLPEDTTRPGDTTAPPDGAAAPAPGAADRTGNAREAGRADNARDAERAEGEAVRTAGNAATIPSRQLPVTGGALTLTLVVLGAGMVAVGVGAVTVARRRVQA